MKKQLGRLSLLLCLAAVFYNFGWSENNNQPMNNTEEIAVLGAGCFWCVEAVYDQLEGVSEVTSGYTGGQIKNPGYKEVCTGRTGHAEVCEIKFDPSVISFEELLEVFFFVHDPTQLNRQGNDIGTQYRSSIFYTTPEQKAVADSMKTAINEQKLYSKPIVTEIAAFDVFYPAEDYHQEYFANNGQQPYCSAIVKPKVEKFEKTFKEKLKK